MLALSRLFCPIVNCSKVLLKQPSKFIKTKPRVTTTHHNFYSTEEKWGTKKLNRKVTLKLADFINMADPKIEEVLAPLREKVKEQASFSSPLLTYFADG